MKRSEYEEYSYIKDSLKSINSDSAQLTIRTNASRKYKKALHKLYTKMGFHPASVKIDPARFDSNERIIYIKNFYFRVFSAIKSVFTVYIMI